MQEMECPNCSIPMEYRTLYKQKTFKGVDIQYQTQAYVCPECGFEAGTIESAGNTQRAIADAYREKVGLLTSYEIKNMRENKGMTQQELADAMNIGVASVKRWETCMIQSKSMDYYLRLLLQDRNCVENYTGNREIDICRIKLVAETLEKHLGVRLLKDGDRFLFLAKYLWFADMLAFRQIGKGLTGASYAAITYGPQLNNYRDLINPISKSDSNKAEPLTEKEKNIIQQITERFPNEQEVYNAAHREEIWQESPMGALISYSRAHELTEI